jgi:hypothetical protein
VHNGPAAEVISVVLPLAVLAFAVVRPKGLPEAVAAVPAAGIVSWLRRPGSGWGRAAQHRRRDGDVQRDVVATCADADLSVYARDGAHDRLGAAQSWPVDTVRRRSCAVRGVAGVAR